MTLDSSVFCLGDNYRFHFVIIIKTTVVFIEAPR